VLFTTDYTYRPLTSSVVRAISVVYLLLLVVVITNPAHGIYAEFTFRQTPFSHVELVSGLARVPGIAYVLTSITVGTYYLWNLFESASSEVSVPSKALVAAVLLGVVPLLGSRAGLLPVETYDHTPFGVSVFLLGVSYAVFQHNFYDVSPIARDIILDEVVDPMLVIDGESRLVDHSTAAEEGLPGLDAESLGEPLRAIDQELAEFVSPLLEGEQEELSLTVAGETRQFSVRLSDIEKGETAIGQVIFLRDITERKEFQQQLQYQKTVLEAQAEASISGILLVDEDRNILFANSKFADLWDVPPELLETGTDEDALTAAMDSVADPEQLRETVEHLYENPLKTQKTEFQMADGRWFDRYTTPVVGEDGTYYGRLWLNRDITERKQREEQLQRQNERLDQFASMVSHDLRNPLNVAQLRADLLDADNENTAAIISALERMETMIDDMLALARAGQDIESTEQCRLGDLAKSAWVNVPSGESQLESRFDEATIEADESRLVQIFENLFRNAVEHNDQPVTVRVGPLAERSGFYIEDTGAGIPPAERESIFEHGYSSSESGSGFGLAIVSDVVEGHDWKIDVTKSGDGGARFEISGVDIPN
jgi:PAS domain S-box-containing protein